MNFLSHDWALGAGLPALTHVGAAMPDLWTQCPVRPLPLVVLRRLRADPDPEAAVLAFGIAHHMHADAAFHAHPEFQARTASVAERLPRHLGGTLHRWLGGHVLVEMLLDRWLIDHDPRLVDEYYARFDDDRLRRASVLSSADLAAQDGIAGVLDRFVAARFLADYVTFEGIADRFVRTMRRVGGIGAVAVDERALADEIAMLHEALAPGSYALLHGVVEAVRTSLSGAGFALLGTPPASRMSPSAA